MGKSGNKRKRTKSGGRRRKKAKLEPKITAIPSWASTVKKLDRSQDFVDFDRCKTPDGKILKRVVYFPSKQIACVESWGRTEFDVTLDDDVEINKEMKNRAGGYVCTACPNHVMKASAPGGHKSKCTFGRIARGQHLKVGDEVQRNGEGRKLTIKKVKKMHTKKSGNDKPWVYTLSNGKQFNGLEASEYIKVLPWATCSACGAKRITKKSVKTAVVKCGDKNVKFKQRPCNSPDDAYVDGWGANTKSERCPFRHRMCQAYLIPPKIQNCLATEDADRAKVSKRPEKCSKCKKVMPIGTVVRWCATCENYAICMACNSKQQEKKAESKKKKDSLVLKWLGNKDDLLDHLPKPRDDINTIVEYFGGGAVYLCEHGQGKKCIFNEVKREAIVRLNYLKFTPKEEIENLPIIYGGESLKMDKFDVLGDGAKLFLGLEIAQKTYRLNYGINPMEGLYWTPRRRKQVADNVYRVKNFEVLNEDVFDIDPPKGADVCHFFDPPYEVDGGAYYNLTSKKDKNDEAVGFQEFGRLRKYILEIERENPHSMIIVTEGSNAKWIKHKDFLKRFKPLDVPEGLGHVVYINKDCGMI